MIGRWTWNRRAAETQAPAGVGGDDPGTPETTVHTPGAAPPQSWDSGPSLLDAWREMQPTRLQVEVDDATVVPVVLDDHNAGRILETTQRFREYREREKSAVPPVYDFGGESFSSGGEW